MRIRFRPVTAIAALLLVPALLPVFAQQAGNLQERMSAEEFYDAGLNKLSAQELSTLNQWLATHGGAATGTAAPAAAAGSAAAAVTAAEPAIHPAAGTKRPTPKRQAFQAHIVGSFTGFSGDSLISLDNGQQWQQVGDDKPMCTSADSPQVKIKPTLFGNWLIDVPTCNLLVHVQRVK
jgi:hypothetical protein